MPIVKFEYSVGKDIRNAVRIINKQTLHDKNEDDSWAFGRLTPEFVAEMRAMGATDEQKNRIGDYIKGEHKKAEELIEQRIKLFTERWGLVSDAYFKKIENIFPGAFSPDGVFVAYLTSPHSCPFNLQERWFMVRYDDVGADATAAHELFHFAFYRKYGSRCMDELKLTRKEYWDFQEATTFLLNEEMGGMLSRPDYGYKEHRKLRAMLTDEWKKHKDFDALLAYYVTIKDS